MAAKECSEACPDAARPAGASAGGSPDRLPDGPQGWGRAVVAGLWGPRSRPLWVTAVAGLALFAIFRAILLLVCRDLLIGVGAGGVVRCFLVGLRFDAIPTGLGLLPLIALLTLAPDAAMRRPRLAKLAVWYAASALTFALLIEIIGAGFFVHEGARLNWMSIGYVSLEAAEYIWENYWVGLLLFPPVMLVALLIGRRLLRSAFGRLDGPSGPRWLRPLPALLLLALVLATCRAGPKGQAGRLGSASFSDNRIISQLTLNNFFTGFSAVRSRIRDSRDELALFPFPPVEHAADVTCAMCFQPDDTPLPTPTNRLWRRSDSALPQRDLNVVIVLMEGMSGEPVGALGHEPSYTPNLDAICRDGLFFDRMYAVGARTSRGLVGVLCGHPDLGGTSLLKGRRSRGDFLTLAEILRDRGYETMMIYAGRGKFDNMAEFFGRNGFDTIIEQKDLGPDSEAGNWGFPDEVVFRKAHETFEQPRGRPFFAMVVTVSNHEPYEIPAGRIDPLPGDDEDTLRLNAYRYADWSLGEFFRMARGSSYFDQTLFVLVADHGHGLDRRRVVDVPGYRVPCVIYGPGLLPPGRVDTVAGQTDIAPTLMALLGGSCEHCFMGRNVLAVPPGEGFAFMHEDEQLAMVRGRHALLQRPGSPPVLLEIGPESMDSVSPSEDNADEIALVQEMLLSYYRTALDLYLSEAYCSPMSHIAAAGR